MEFMMIDFFRGRIAARQAVGGPHNGFGREKYFPQNAKHSVLSRTSKVQQPNRSASY
jgi:hypothetical protein